MGQIKTGHFEQDGGAVYVPVGYVPNYLLLVDYHTSTNIILYHWWSEMETEEAANAQEGFSVAEGVTARLADDGGIAAYNSGSEGPTVTAWTTAVSTAATARSATAAGTFVKPSTSGTIDTGETADRSLIFECITAGTGGSTEPTWNPAVGGQTVDGSTVWETVVEPTVRKGYQGFSIAAALMTDGQEAYYLALQADNDVNLGDSSLWTSGIADPDQME